MKLKKMGIWALLTVGLLIAGNSFAADRTINIKILIDSKDSIDVDAAIEDAYKCSKKGLAIDACIEDAFQKKFKSVVDTQWEKKDVKNAKSTSKKLEIKK